MPTLEQFKEKQKTNDVRKIEKQNMVKRRREKRKNVKLVIVKLVKLFYTKCII